MRVMMGWREVEVENGLVKWKKGMAMGWLE